MVLCLGTRSRRHVLDSILRVRKYAFRTTAADDGLVDLKELYQTSTVEDYQRRFLATLCHCKDVSATQKVHKFVAGLAEPLRTDVELEDPSNLQTAMKLVRAFERRQSHTGAATPTATNSGSSSKPSNPTSSALSKTPAANLNKPRLRRLSAEELAAKRARGECFYCTEKYTADHKCSTGCLLAGARQR
jgi:hypothetical protein